MPCFKYTPLENPHEERRLVRLLSPEKGVIRCRIEHFSSSTLPDYDALSYVWGSEDDMQLIQMNGCSFSIRNNLWQFLMQASTSGFRYTSGVTLTPGYIWIDQLCIDQESEPEKSAQVMDMHRIFEHARSGIVWLGPARPETVEEVAILEKKATGAREDWTRNLELDLDEGLRDVPKFKQIANLNILKLPYWTRIWTVQEFVIPDRLTMILGTVAFDASLLEDLKRGAEKCDTTFLESASGASPYLRWRVSSRKVKDTTCAKDVFQAFSHLDCSDSKDKVYGLAALLATRTSCEPIPVDYSKSPTEIYEQIALILERDFIMSAQADPLDVLRRLGAYLQVPEQKIATHLEKVASIEERYHSGSIATQIIAERRSSLAETTPQT